MKILLNIAIIFLMLTGALMAAEDKTIPLISDSAVEFDLSRPQDRQRFETVIEKYPFESAVMKKGDSDKLTLTTKKKIGDSSASEIAAVVKDLRAALCSSLKKGDSIKFAMSWDASAKVWGIGVSGQTGVEVQISCP